LISAANDVIARYGALDVPWGDVHRLLSAGNDWPASGASDPLGVLRDLDFGPPQDGKQVAVGGDTFTAVVEFGERPHAAAVLPYGNAGPNGTTRFLDQMGLYAAGTLRPVWTQRPEIEQHVVAREFPTVDLR
jgi:acyl-homoserine-lactone acylase